MRKGLFAVETYGDDELKQNEVSEIHGDTLTELTERIRR